MAQRAPSCTFNGLRYEHLVTQYGTRQPWFVTNIFQRIIVSHETKSDDSCAYSQDPEFLVLQKSCITTVHTLAVQFFSSIWRVTPYWKTLNDRCFGPPSYFALCQQQIPYKFGFARRLMAVVCRVNYTLTMTRHVNICMRTLVPCLHIDFRVCCSLLRNP